ncbi:uncharacterized protein MKZ38_006955 [Zalerion maritima]|uniref:Uncharacterized protein n=1 Tax=Zalerion maritima TaxID=339359 RepID=A0AAD5RVD2_9PEZI|nr:uncharacterized protein MKZ38_006955 [Zalerion maritima]
MDYTQSHFTSYNLEFTTQFWNNTICPGTPFTITWNETLYSGTLSLAVAEAVQDGESQWGLVETIASHLTSTSFTWIPDTSLPLDPSSTYTLILDDGTRCAYSPAWRPASPSKYHHSHPIPSDMIDHFELHRRIDTSQPDISDSNSTAPPPSSNDSGSSTTTAQSVIGPAVGIVAAAIFVNTLGAIAVHEHKKQKKKKERRRREEERVVEMEEARGEGGRRRRSSVDSVESTATFVDYDVPVVYPEPAHVRRERARGSSQPGGDTYGDGDGHGESAMGVEAEGSPGSSRVGARSGRGGRSGGGRK